MQEKEPIIAVRCKLKIPSLGITLSVTFVTEFSMRTSQLLKILIYCLNKTWSGVDSYFTDTIWPLKTSTHMKRTKKS